MELTRDRGKTWLVRRVFPGFILRGDESHVMLTKVNGEIEPSDGLYTFARFPVIDETTVFTGSREVWGLAPEGDSRRVALHSSDGGITWKRVGPFLPRAAGAVRSRLAGEAWIVGIDGSATFIGHGGEVWRQTRVAFPPLWEWLRSHI